MSVHKLRMVIELLCTYFCLMVSDSVLFWLNLLCWTNPSLRSNHTKLQNYLVLQEVISICLQLEWTWQQFALMVEPSWMSILICYNNILHNIVNCFFRMWTTSNCNLYRVVLNCWGGLNAKFWKLQQHFHKCSKWFLCMSISKKS